MDKQIQTFASRNKNTHSNMFFFLCSRDFLTVSAQLV